MDEKTESLTSKEEQKPCTAQEFAKKYQILCDECGYRVIVSPVWLARDDNTFSMQLHYTVGALPKAV
jgi:hypothetical protein